MNPLLKDLKIKDSWEQITISDFMQMEEINSSAKNSLEKMIHTLAVLSGVQDSYFNQFLVPELTELFKKLDFLKTPPEFPLKEYYNIGGKEYKLINQISELTTGQFIDLDHFTKDANGRIDNLHIICSIFLMPVIPKTLLQRGIEKTKLKKFRPLEHYMETPLAETSETSLTTCSMGMQVQSVFFFACSQTSLR